MKSRFAYAPSPENFSHVSPGLCDELTRTVMEATKSPSVMTGIETRSLSRVTRRHSVSPSVPVYPLSPVIFDTAVDSAGRLGSAQNVATQNTRSSQPIDW